MNNDMNLGGVDWSQFTFPGLQNPEISLSELETGTAEELFQSTVGSSGPPVPTEHNGASNPVLSPPDFSLFPPSRNQIFAPDNLTKDDLITLLKGYPQYQTFIGSQSVVSQDNLISHIREVLSQNINTPYSLESLVGKGLADEMNLVLQAHPNSALESGWMDLRATLLVQNHPLAGALIEVETNEFVSKGIAPLLAATMAKAAVVNQLDKELSENGVITPFYGMHPKMEGILDKLIRQKLEGSPILEQFLGDLKGAMNFRGGFLDALGKAANVASPDKPADPHLHIEHGIAYAEQSEQLVQKAIDLLNKVALPAGEKQALLAFMTKISEALHMMKQLAAELNQQDLSLHLSKEQTEIKEAVQELKMHLRMLDDVMAKIEAAEKLAKTMSIVKLVITIISTVMFCLLIIILFVVMVVVITIFTVLIVAIAINIVCLVVLGLVLTFVALVITIVASFIAGIASASFAISQTGAMDTMMKGLFDFWMLLLNEVCKAHVSDEVGAYIMIGIIGAIVLAVLLVIILVIIIAILLIIILAVAIVLVAVVAIVIMACMLMVGSIWVCLIATIITAVLAVVMVVVVIVAVVLVVILIVVLFFVCMVASQFLPELLIRSGLIDTIVSSMGKTFGMSDEQMAAASLALRVVFALGTIMTCQSVSSSFWSLSKREQRLVDTKGDTQAQIDKDNAEMERLLPYNSIYNPSWSDAGRAAGLTSDQIAENAVEVAKMLKILQDIIKKLEKLLAMILAGGSADNPQGAADAVTSNGSNIDDIISSIQEMIDHEITNYIGPKAVAEQPNLKLPMKAMLEILALAAARSIPAETYRSLYYRDAPEKNTQEEELRESLLTTQGVSD